MAIPEPTTAPVAHLVPIKDIKEAPWNPKSRVSERRLTTLRISVDDLAEMYYPVLLDPHKNLIDGHRRLAVAKSFGWKRICAITVKHSLESAYGSIQLTQQRLTGNDRLGVYLSNPKALTGKHRHAIALIEKRLGRWAVADLYRAGMSESVYHASRRVQRLLGRVGMEIEAEEVFRWIVKHSLGTAAILLVGGFPPKEMYQKIKADKPIRME